MTVYYETFGEVYASDHKFRSEIEADAWVAYMLTFGYVTRAWRA